MPLTAILHGVNVWISAGYAAKMVRVEMVRHYGSQAYTERHGYQGMITHYILSKQAVGAVSRFIRQRKQGGQSIDVWSVLGFVVMTHAWLRSRGLGLIATSRWGMQKPGRGQPPCQCGLLTWVRHCMAYLNQICRNHRDW